jgi:monoamine oxidase
MNTRKEHILIAGGGAAGLMASNGLLKQNYDVTILEADSRLGGRINTLHHPLFKQPVEKAVEFIHGNLPLTTRLLREAGIKYEPVRGKMIRAEGGEWKTQNDFAVGWEEIMQRMNEVKEDMTLEKFLEKNFSGEKYKDISSSVLRFAEGFDLADPADASLLALREEWMEEEHEQYRITGGYDQLVHFLEKRCITSGGIIHLSSPVTEIKWSRNDVTVITGDKKVWRGNKIIITVSLGVLQADPLPISFQPAIDHYIEAAKKIGYGSVVKVLLQFKEAFWKEKNKNMGFLFANEAIPTWWTQLPSSYPLLTGWVGGPQAKNLETENDETILALALQSLSNIFKEPVDKLRELLTASWVANWRNDPFARGAYSYGLLGSWEAKKLFNTPVDDTLFFAGEAFYNGSSPGTVEAALVSGKEVAEKISIE